MIGQGRDAIKMLKKQNIIETYQELLLYKPVGIYQFTTAGIRAFVIIVY